jgi:hypothetical protein
MLKCVYMHILYMYVYVCIYVYIFYINKHTVLMKERKIFPANGVRSPSEQKWKYITSSEVKWKRIISLYYDKLYNKFYISKVHCFLVISNQFHFKVMRTAIAV